MCQFFEKCGYPASVIQAAHHRVQEIDRQSALQTSQKEKNDRISFTLTFHPHNNPVKAIILNNFKILQNDPETGAIFFATTADFIQTRQKRRQLSSQKHIQSNWEAWHLQMHALAMQNLSFRSKRWQNIGP